MGVDLWISIALAILLAIAANIVTPKVQGWIDRRASQGKERKTEQEYKRRQS